ncbi:uncharacterized protein CTRU02_213376 [Colletotrichum truncatum]|uniref:Uncharacterized protein n=1 Tax=Colletotrichum truncatum TaxID=5467 RepID=A0ACC3YKI9_COLTU
MIYTENNHFYTQTPNGDVSQMSTTPSYRPTATVFPSGENAAAVTNPSIPGSVFTAASTCPEYVSEISIPFSVRHAKYLQSGDNANGHPSSVLTLFNSQLHILPPSCSQRYTARGQTDTITLPSLETPKSHAPRPVAVTTPSTSILLSVLPVLASDILTVPSRDNVTTSPLGKNFTCVGSAWFTIPATLFEGNIPLVPGAVGVVS